MFAYIREKITGKFNGWQIHPPVRCFFFAILGTGMAFIGVPHIAWQGLVLLVYTAPLWVLTILPKSFWYYWIHYVNHQFLDGPTPKPMVLEVKLHSNIQKSPRAMEMVLEALYIKPSTTTEFQRYWRGNVRPWWSFEIVSNAGEVKFYIWLWARTRARLESTLYAHYPDVQLVEVPDYTKGFEFDFDKMMCVGSNYCFYHGDEHPIKTYYDFGLDKDPKTEYKIDPLVTFLDLMGQIKTGQIWLQICIQQAVDDKSWRTRVANSIQLMYDETSPEWPDPSDPEKSTKGSAILRPMQYEYIKAMQRATTKSAFDTGIRFAYFDKKENFSGAVVHNMLNMYKLVGSQDGPYYNWLAADEYTYTADFDWPWEDFGGYYFRYKTRKLFKAFKARSFYHPPVIDYTQIMTSEQIATIYHFPGAEAQTLGLERMESTRAAPPPDLPV